MDSARGGEEKTAAPDALGLAPPPRKNFDSDKVPRQGATY